MSVWCWLCLYLGLIQIRIGTWVVYLGITKVIQLENCDRLVLARKRLLRLRFHLVSSLQPEASIDFLTTSISKERVHIAFGCCPMLTVALGLDSPDKTLAVPKDEVSP